LKDYYAITVTKRTEDAYVTRYVGRAYQVGTDWRYALDAGYTWLGHRSGAIGEPDDGQQLDVDGPEGRVLATLKHVHTGLNHKTFKRRIVKQ